MLPSTLPRNIALALIGIWRSRQRQRELRKQLDTVQRRMAKRRTIVTATMAALAVQEEKERKSARQVERANGKWRGSTLYGYLTGGSSGRDEQTYLENFRMSIGAFDKLVSHLEATPFASEVAPVSIVVAREAAKQRRGQTPPSTLLCRMHTDPAPTRFKTAACLYLLGQGGPLKPSADVASVGKTTLRRWMSSFCASVNSAVRQIYMPAKPWNADELAAVRGNFASRRGIPNVALACDGSHIPFNPKCSRKDAKEYKNYKGWNSILAVAFVDSYYRFFDVDVGAVGKSGDNTVLKHNWLMKEMAKDPDKWLGEHGVVLGDSGASDKDGIFMNPYHAPTAPEKCWFNFCHSSTRFYVEETFGRWKSKWRFLVNPVNVNHKLMTTMIYTSAVLHNYCLACARDDDHVNFFSCNAEGSWKKFLDKYTAHLCPSCKRRGVKHCVHQAAYRNGNAQVAAARRAPSQVRDDLCQKLWEQVLGPDPLGICVVGDADVRVAEGLGDSETWTVREVMQMRAERAPRGPGTGLVGRVL